ncbi:MAG: purine-nucleoside phosphorylase [Actinomycetota bacterium]
MTHSIEDATGRRHHDVAVMLGSGRSELAGGLVGENSVPYKEITGMPVPRVEGHEATLHSGDIGGAATLVFAGRAHLYEGHDAKTVTHWVRAAHDAGCRTFILTNAAGGISSDLEIGEPCLISDHINLTGTNPLIGPNHGPGPRFPDMSNIYSPELRSLSRSVDPELKEGVYAGVLGPSYETPAEVRMLASLGADLVGMSTVLEAIVAHYLGGRVLGISTVSNRAAGLRDEALSHEEVIQATKQSGDRVVKLITGVIRSLR